jgi:hypothetical protein
MATIGKVSAVFTASTSGLRTGVNQASRSMQQMQSSVSALRGQLSTLTAIQGAQLFGQIANAASQAVQSLVRFGASAAQSIDRTAKLSQQLGLTYAEMSGLSLAASLAGTDMETVGNAVTKANAAFANAAAGSKSAIAAFQRIGLSVDDLNGLSAADQFEKIGQAIASLPSEAEQAAAAIALFGRSGAQLLPLFQGGAKGIQQARADAEKFGLALSNVQAGNVEAMNDAFTRARGAVEGVVNQVVAYLAPALENVTTVFTDLIGGIGGANIGQFIGEAILSGARFFAGVADQFVAQAGPLFDYLASVGQQWSAMWDIGQRVASLFAGIGNLLKAAILTAILPFSGLVQGLARIGKEIAGYLGFDTSSIDAILEGARAFNSEIVQGIKDQVGQAGENFGNVIGEKTKKAGEDVAGPFTKALDDATRRAREAAAARDEAVKQVVEVKQPPVEVNVGPIKEAVKGIESRSSEGIREMFRLMRGQPEQNIDQEQLQAQQETARNTRDLLDSLDFGLVSLPAGAGA